MVMLSLYALLIVASSRQAISSLPYAILSYMKTQDMTPGKIGWKPTRSELYEWLDKQILCTLSTIGDGGYPNGATVAFSQDAMLDFLLITDRRSRKAQNMRAHSKVSLTITNEDDRYTVQLEGRAEELTWDEFTRYETHHYEKLPYSLPFRDVPGQTPFRITPVHIRFSDVSVRPWETTESYVSE